MNNPVKQYLSYIRGNSAYANFRSFLGLAKFLGYAFIILGGILSFTSWFALSSQIAGLTAGILFSLIATGISIWVSILVLHFSIDLFLMIADFCDSTLQKNAEGFELRQSGGKVSKAAMEESGLPFVKKNAVDKSAFKEV